MKLANTKLTSLRKHKQPPTSMQSFPEGTSKHPIQQALENEENILTQIDNFTTSVRRIFTHVNISGIAIRQFLS